MGKVFRSRVVINEKGSHRYVDIDKDLFVVGRAHTSDIVMKEQFLSRSQIEVSVISGNFWVQDVGSRNGTWLDGKRIQEKIKIQVLPGQFLSFENPNGASSVTTLSFELIELQNNQILQKVSGGETLVNTIAEENIVDRNLSLVKKISVIPDMDLPPGLPIVDDLIKTSIHSDRSTDNKLEILQKVPGVDEVFKQINSLIRQESVQLVEEAKNQAARIISNAELAALDKKNEIQKEIDNNLESFKAAEAQSRLQVVRLEESCSEIKMKIEDIKALKLVELKQLEEIQQDKIKIQESLKLEHEQLNLEKQKIEDEKLKIQEGFHQLDLIEIENKKRIKEDNLNARMIIDGLRKQHEELDKQFKQKTIEAEDRLLQEKDKLISIEKEMEEASKIKSRYENDIKRLRNESVNVMESTDKLRLEHRQKKHELDLVFHEIKSAQQNLESTRLENKNTILDIEKRNTELKLLRDELSQRDVEIKVLYEKATHDSKNMIADATIESSRILSQTKQSVVVALKAGEDELERLSHKKKELSIQLEKMSDLISDNQNLAQQEIDRGKVESSILVEDAKKQATFIKNQAKLESDKMLAELMSEVFSRKEESLKAFTETEKQRLAIENKIEVLNETARLTSLEIQSKHDELLFKLKSEAELFKSNLIQENEILRNTHKNSLANSIKLLNEDASARKASLELEYNKLKTDQESLIAQYKLVEMNNIKEIRHKSEQEWQDSRNKRAATVSENVYTVVHSSVLKLRNKVVDDSIIDAFGIELKDIVMDIMLDRPVAYSEKLQDIIKTSVNTKEKERLFWRKLAFSGGGIVVLSIILLIFPSIYTYPRDLLHSAFTEKSTEMADKFARDQIQVAKKRFDYSPPTTNDHKASYTDNVLYTTDFLIKRSSQAFQDKWILELNDYFINSLDVKDTTIIKFVSLEMNFLKDLSKLKSMIDPASPESKIEEMRAREIQFKEKLALMFADPEKVAKYYDFSANFWNKFYKIKK